jgi:CheY-like chemotaxis protein
MVGERTRRILLVDDSAILRDVLQVYLMGMQCEFHLANNGREALECAGRLHPDLVISDIQMPELTGLELCKAMRASPILGDIPVVLISTQSDTKTRREVVQSGAYGFLPKPVDSQRLATLVMQILRYHPSSSR